MIEENSNFFKSMRKIGEMAQDITNAISVAIVPVIEFTKEINEYLSSEKVQTTFRNFVEGIIQTEEDIKNYKEVIVLIGYPPSISTDITLMRQIGQEFMENRETGLKDIIDDVMKKHYSPKKIDEIKSLWESFSFLLDRKSLLRQALTAHNLGMYALSIPSLLSQMEGIIVDGYKIKQKVEGWQFKKLVRQLFNNPDNEAFDFDNELREFYLKFILARFNHGQEIQSDVSRHAILHGGAKPVNFAKEEVSLKIILMMENIIYRIDNLTENEIREAKKKLGFY
ncbi:hypothetical protein ABET51_06790 [Metabacillus fastidiosus]|uniref:hypothetical protein n=1 Tax=Metabacillus fastidiosus TaxID=1458 RepID=UPI003D2C1BAC